MAFFGPKFFVSVFSIVLVMTLLEVFAPIDASPAWDTSVVESFQGYVDENVDEGSQLAVRAVEGDKAAKPAKKSAVRKYVSKAAKKIKSDFVKRWRVEAIKPTA